MKKNGINKISDLKQEEQTLHEVYCCSPDMQMFLNLLTEKKGIWASIIILSVFDKSFKSQFKVENTNLLTFFPLIC